MVNQEFIQALRELEAKIKESQTIADNALKMTEMTFETQVSHMISTYPEIWGIGGSKRTWLERKCSEVGLAIDEELEMWNLPEEK